MNKFIYLYFFLFAVRLNAAIVELPQQQPKKIILLTVPKSGTFLIAKALWLIMGRDVKWVALATHPDPIIDPLIDLDPRDPTIVLHHLFSSFDSIKEDKSGKYLKIIQIRDPRDALVSQIEWMTDCPRCWYAPGNYMLKFSEFTFYKKLKTAILFPETEGFYSMHYFFRNALKWAQEPDVFVSRFEDLVGPQGGGNRMVQEKAINDLAEYLGYKLDKEDVEEIADQLFGDAPTFKTGQIGNWRKKFTPVHYALFKMKFGNELTQLGYQW